MGSSSRIPRVFISYTNRDRLGRDYAITLKGILEDAGFSDVYFFDHSSRSSLGHLLWEDSGIPFEIRKRDVLILICTLAIKASRPGIREFNIALYNDKMVIPPQYDAAELPYALEPDFRDKFDKANCRTVFRIVANNLPKSYARFRENQIQAERLIATVQRTPEEVELRPQTGGMSDK